MKAKFELWNNIVEGLKAQPAYLLVFGLCSLIILGGGFSLNNEAVRSNTFMFASVIFLMCFVLLIAYLVICKVETSPKVKRRRETASFRREIKSVYPKQVRTMEEFKDAVAKVLEQDTRYDNINLGLRFKDPAKKMPMLHKIVGDPGELERMANIMASFIDITIKENKLKFDKVVIPKSGNALFGVRAAEKTGYPLVGYRGKDFSIADEEALPIQENYFDGILEDGDRVIIIDDITFRGDTVRETVSFLNKANVKVLAVFVLSAHEEHVGRLRESLDKEYGGVKFFPILEI